MIRTRKKSRSSGLTLVELLVVLTILAILTTVAVVSTETVLQQGRFEATQRTLQAIEEAVLGPGVYRSEDGTLATSGFVADMGRLPTDLSELWDLGSLPPFDFVRADAANLHPDDKELADEDVFVPCGWRGPYLRRPIGAAELLDGWGREFEILPETGEILVVRSLGADGLPGSNPEDPYSQFLELDFAPGGVARYRTNIQITVWQREDGELKEPSSGSVDEVRLFGPEDGGVGVWKHSIDDSESPWSVNFDNVPIGPHVIRAYHESDPVSPPLSIHVHPRRSTTWRLVIEE